MGNVDGPTTSTTLGRRVVRILYLFAILILGLLPLVGIGAQRMHTRLMAETDRADQARAVAADNAAKLQANSDILPGALQLDDPIGIMGPFPGRSPTAAKETRLVELLRQGTRKANTELSDRPLIRAQVLETVGRTYQTLGMFDEAEALLNTALHLRQASGNALETAEGFQCLGALYVERFHLHKEDETKAREMLQAAREIQTESQQGQDDHVCETLMLLGWNALQLEYYREAEDYFRQVEHRRKDRFPNDVMLLKAYLALGTIQAEQGNAVGALLQSLNTFPYMVELSGDEDLKQAFNLVLTGWNSFRANDFPAAVGTLQTARHLIRKSRGDQHIYVAVLDFLLAWPLERLQRQADAERSCRECLDILTATVGLAHPLAPLVLTKYVLYIALRGQRSQAHKLFADYRSAVEQRYGPNHFRVANALLVYAELLDKGREYVAQEKAAREVLRIYRLRDDARKRLKYPDALNSLASALLAQKKYDEVGKLLTEASEICAEREPAPKALLGQIGKNQKRLQEAQKLKGQEKTNG